MLLADLEHFLASRLDGSRFDSIDAALNGLQVGRGQREIRRVACAVDACMESFRRAADGDADLLFVHHGIFWTQQDPFVRSRYERLQFLITHDLALYGSHLPLDANPQLGNNAQIAQRLGLSDLVPFGMFKGVPIGWKGRLDAPLTMDAVIERLSFDPESCTARLRMGPENSTTVGVVSGGGTRMVGEAVSEGLDLYITGDASHETYHFCLEESLNLLCAGHYQTETFGVRAVADLIRNETDIETFFVDVPTGL